MEQEIAEQVSRFMKTVEDELTELYEKSYMEGRADGYDLGHEDGYDEGYETGYRVGQEA